MESSIVKHSSWATTSQKTSIELYSFVNGSSDKRPLLFVGGVHGDEPEGVRLASEFLNWLLKNNKAVFPSWYLIPCFNVDGFSKNKRTNANGVDLNRNFPTPDWSPEHKAPRYFPGSAPNSEPETQALVKLIHAIRPQLIVHFHSWEPCVVYTGAPGKRFADVIAEPTGYESREDIGYPTPGSLGQYGWLVHKTPVICVEEQEGCDLDEVWPRFGSGLQRLLSEI